MPEDLDIMVVLKKSSKNLDSNKSVQEVRRAEEADFYFMDPLNKEDEEDDGTFFAKASDDETMRNLKWLFEKVVQPNFTLNQQINGGTLCSIILQKNQVELEP